MAASLAELEAREVRYAGKEQKHPTGVENGERSLRLSQN